MVHTDLMIRSFNVVVMQYYIFAKIWNALPRLFYSYITCFWKNCYDCNIFLKNLLLQLLHTLYQGKQLLSLYIYKLNCQSSIFSPIINPLFSRVKWLCSLNVRTKIFCCAIWWCLPHICAGGAYLDIIPINIYFSFFIYFQKFWTFWWPTVFIKQKIRTLNYYYCASS